MKKKGFTLIELLAVIVILAVIALIVTPIVTGIISRAKESANARSVEGHIKGVEYNILQVSFSDINSINKYDGTYPINNVNLLTRLENDGMHIQDNDKIDCETYVVSNGVIIEATGCTETGWSKTYNYTNTGGAVASGSGSEQVDPYSMAAMCPGCKFYDMHDNEYESYEDAVAANLEIFNDWDEGNYDGNGHLAVYAHIYGVEEGEIDEDTTPEELVVVRAFVCGSLHAGDPFCLEASNNDEEVIERNLNILRHFFDFDNECSYYENDWTYQCWVGNDAASIMTQDGIFSSYPSGSVQIWIDPNEVNATFSDNSGVAGWYY